MKRPLYSVIFCAILALCLSWYTGNIISQSALNERDKEQIVTVQSIQVTTLQIVSSTTTLRRGQTGVITIQGKPNTTYTIETSCSIGGNPIAVKQWRTTDSSGKATFNWVVDERTDPSTQRAYIYGGGERIETSHTVLVP
jgi:hypothetical protein